MPVHALGEGTLDGQPYRKSLKTRSFERAEKLKREIEDGTNPEEQAKRTSVKDALAAFVTDREVRNLNQSTLGKYERLTESLLEFSEQRGHLSVIELTTEPVRDFRNTWNLSPRTASKQLELLRQIFKFAIENGWLIQNPAKSIKAPQVKPNPTLPFSEIEISKIMSASKFRAQVFYRM